MAETEAVKKYDLDRVVRLVLTVAGVLLTIYLVDYLTPILLPFLIGFLLAYILDPVVRGVMRFTHICNRAVAVVITLVLVIGLITGACWLLFPYLAEEFSQMGKLLANYAKQSFHDIPFVPDAVQKWLRANVDFNQIANFLSKDQWMDLVKKVASGTWTFVDGTMNVIVSVVSWLIVLLYMFFIMLDLDKIARGFKSAVPKKYRRIAFRVMDDVEETMSRYFRGQALVSFFVGVIFAIEFYIIGLPMAIVFGLFVGVLNMVPYLQLLSIPVAAFLCLVQSVSGGTTLGFWTLFALTIGAYLLCQVIQDLILIPAIMKQQMGLNPAVIFLSLSLWAYVLGFVGLIIALPLTTLIISYYCEFVLGESNQLRKQRLKRASVRASGGGSKKRPFLCSKRTIKGSKEEKKVKNP